MRLIDADKIPFCLIDEVGGEYAPYLGCSKEQIDNLPSATHIRPKGAWVGIDEEPHETWECDHCGFVIDCSGCPDPRKYRDAFKFCPSCGTEMLKAESEKV